MEKIRSLFAANFFTTGLAMFAMFFGSGNLIFPVAVGQMAGDQNIYAIFGLFITSVVVPFATLTLMLLYKGDYHRFFQSVGPWPGRIITFATLALIGPFGVLPRCIAFSYSTFSLYSDVSIFVYSAIACCIVFLLSVKESDVVSVIGNFLTPVLLIALGIVIVSGLSSPAITLPKIEEVSHLMMMSRGFIEGYKTFDIFAALFFASAIIPAFNKMIRDNSSNKDLMKLAVKSSLVGMTLLIGVYAGLSFVAAHVQGGLVGVSGDQLLGVITTLTMGSNAGLVANIVVMLACLTTAISLAVVSAEFFRREVFFNKLSYVNCLVVTVGISFVFSLLGFSGIMQLVLPILMVLCPSVIVLALLNALNYFFGWKHIKAPFFLVLLISLFVTIVGV